MRAVFDALAGSVTGVLSGWGLGGGTLLMVYMSTLGGLAQHAAQGVSLLYFIPCSSAALWGHIKGKQIEWRAALPAIGAGILTAGAAAWAAQSVDGGWLRKIFGVGLLAVGLREIFGKSRPADS